MERRGASWFQLAEAAGMVEIDKRKKERVALGKKVRQEEGKIVGGRVVGAVVVKE